MLRYALYARKSKEDNSGIIKSIQDQKDVLYHLAKERGLYIVTEFEENKSAKTPGNRPVYLDMIQRIKQGEINSILVWHINRLGRNMAEGGELAQLLIDGVIKEIRTPSVIYKPGDNILPLLLEQGMSTQYSRDLSEAVKRGMHSVVEQGGWPHQAKFGYLNVRNPDDQKRGLVIPDPNRWELTRRGFELMLTGNYSVKQAINTMNAWGIQTRKTPTRPGGPLSYSLGYDMFTNIFYAGYTMQNGVVRRGKHQAMITLAEYHQIQAHLNRRRKKRQHSNTYPYTGLIRCGNCGLMITAERKIKKGREYMYYHCSDYRNTCSKRAMTEANVTKAIGLYLATITVDPALCEIAYACINKWLGEERFATEGILTNLKQRIVEIDQQRDNLLNMMLSGVLTDRGVYQRKDEELVNDRNRTELEIDKVQEDTDNVRQQARNGLTFLQEAQAAFEIADDETKKELARSLASRYTLTDAHLSIESDPLLEELIEYVNQIMITLEPRITGSEEQYRPFFTKQFVFGRGAQTRTGDLLVPNQAH